MPQLDAKTENAVRRFMHLMPGRFPVNSAILFGSRARGTHDQDSDADLAIILNGAPQPVLRTSLELADLAFDVLLETGINITPIPVWIDEWDHPQTHSNPLLLANIASEGVRFSCVKN
jgi:predicted nucleotidyltransferase